MFSPPSKNVITSLTLASELSSLLFVNKTYRVLLLQGGQIYCPTLLIPEIGKATLLNGECKGSFKKEVKNRQNVEYLKA